MQKCPDIFRLKVLHMKKKQWCHLINHKEIQDGIQDGFQNLLIVKMAIIMLRHAQNGLFIHCILWIKAIEDVCVATFKMASKMAK